MKVSVGSCHVINTVSGDEMNKEGCGCQSCGYFSVLIIDLEIFKDCINREQCNVVEEMLFKKSCKFSSFCPNLSA